jgi:hypothetical protein
VRVRLSFKCTHLEYHVHLLTRTLVIGPLDPLDESISLKGGSDLVGGRWCQVDLILYYIIVSILRGDTTHVIVSNEVPVGKVYAARRR